MLFTVHSIGGFQDLEAVDVPVLVEVVVPEMLHDHLRLAQVLHVNVLFVDVRFQMSENARSCLQWRFGADFLLFAIFVYESGLY